MRYYLILFFTVCFLNILGCASAPYIPPAVMPAQRIPGIYHRVEQGQTLWQISRMYNADLERIVNTNHISESAHIDKGQLIFIPDVQKPIFTKRYVYGEDFIWPLQGRAVAIFGQTFNNMVNKGINIQPAKSPDVIASRSGKVVFCADDFGSFGKTVIIDHGGGLSTVYARNSMLLVRVGDNVQKGTLIAKAGWAGKDKLVYLHFEIRKGSIPQNPYHYLP